jgi:hypothetical protein
MVKEPSQLENERKDSMTDTIEGDENDDKSQGDDDNEDL